MSNILQLLQFCEIQTKMDQNVPQVSNIQSFHNRFRQVSQQFRLQPAQRRTCNDCTFFFLLILITIAFLGIGFHYIHTPQMKYFLSASTKLQVDSQYIQLTHKLGIQNLMSTFRIICAMIAISVVIALAALCLLVAFPSCIFVTMLFLGFIAIMGVTAIFFYLSCWILAIKLTISIGVLAYILAYSRKKVKIGLALLNISSKFLKLTPTLFLTPICLLILVITFQIFWGMGFIGILISPSQISNIVHVIDKNFINTGLAILWVSFNLFYVLLFYYVFCFVIGTGAAIQYYNLSANYLVQALFRIIKYHLGSFTSASLLIPLVILGRRHFQGEGGIIPCCSCLITGCLKCMQNIFDTLNHNAIMTMSITGQDYFKSAQSTLSLIFDHYPLFYLVDLMSHLILVSGVTFVSGITSIIGFVLLRLNAANPEQTSTQSVGTIMLFFISIGIAITFMSVFSQSLSSMFIIYCFDRKFIQYGYTVSDNVSYQLKRILNHFVPYMAGDYNPNLQGSIRNTNLSHVDQNMRVQDYVRGSQFSQ